MDGVLVDTDASYVEAVVRTLGFLLGDRAQGIDRELVKRFKRSGDWNNDWDLSYGLYCWRLGEPGLSEAEAARATLAQLRERAGARAELAYVEVLGVFEELYNGTRVAVQRYGAVPRVNNDRPLADTETIVLTAQVMDELRALGVTKFGVVTGRVLADWEQVRARIPLPATIALATDEDGRKPDPAPLAKVLDDLRAGRFVSIGDTLNDLRMFQALGRPGHAVTLCPVEDEPTYRAAGGRLFIRALRELPALVKTLT